MAANKFATMLQKNCHKIIVILVYAVLEWILILLLLLNSLFSYLIAKFAKFFGLKPSCTWCSRLDHHAFNSKNITKNSHFDHVCEAHGTEISKMSYCSSHNKLAESKNLCIHCSSSRPPHSGLTSDVSSTVAFFTWMSGQSASEGGEEERCSCCDQILNRNVYPQSLVFKPSWDVLLECFQKNKIVFEADLVGKKTEFQENGRSNDGNSDDQRAFEKGDLQQLDGSKKVEECVSHDSNLEVQEWNSSQTTDDPFWNLGCNEDDESVYIADMLLQNAELMDSDRFICIELINTDTAAAAAAADADADAIEMPLTNSLEDVEGGREAGTRFEALEGSDVDAVERHSRSDAIENLAAPSREIDGADAAGVEEPEKLSELRQNDYNLEELDNCVEAVVGTILPRSSETDSFVNHNTKIGHESSNRGGVESLKTTIERQEKAVNALYAELEEERRAAAEAAKETMAMITKLQEEKAAMQMEAAQYQKMMEEQAEYDQEALQLLNDLMLKREKEKKELEKEMEIYRGNEKTVMIRRRYSCNASSNSNDTHSIDLDDDDTQFGTHQQHNLDDSLEDSIIPDISLAEFDEERVSILEELKVLEAKLFALHDEDAGADADADDLMAKKLLPLFDAADRDKEEEISSQSEAMILMKEELGHVYERLQALEADKDFLKHCIRSMMKGNQGMGLLQEILQHLRDLKSVELSARNMADIPLPDASMEREDREE